MKKILCLLTVLTLFVFTLSAQSPVESVEEPANEEPVTYAAYIGDWIVSDDSITERVKNELLKEGITVNDTLYSFFLSEGTKSFKSSLDEITITLSSSNAGLYILNGEKAAVTYEVTTTGRLYLTEGGVTKLFGTFNEDYSKLYPDKSGGLYLIKKE